MSAYEEADTHVIQHDFMHLSFFADDFREFVDTLVVALREVDKKENPMAYIHPVIVKDNLSSQAEDITKHQAPQA